jgi:hypothetical protein
MTTSAAARLTARSEIFEMTVIAVVVGLRAIGLANANTPKKKGPAREGGARFQTTVESIS